MGKGQLKPSLNTTTHLLDWGRLTIPSANVNAEQLEYPALLLEMRNGSPVLENTLAVPQKLIHTLTTLS